MIISDIGLAGIIRLSTPVLNAIYPVAIVLIVRNRFSRSQRNTVRFTASVLPLLRCGALRGIPDSVLSPLLPTLPLNALGFGWLMPAAVGLLIGLLLPKKTEKA